MAIYTVHEPPRVAGAQPAPERFAFVRDGFYWWGFLLTPFWLLRHRLWLVFVAYIVLVFLVDVGLHALGASSFVIALAGIVISLFVGFEGGSLRRLAYRRRRWTNLGLVSGDDLEDAERRFFDAWLRDASARNRAPLSGVMPPPASAAPAAVPPSGGSGVVGLFPEPGLGR